MSRSGRVDHHCFSAVDVHEAVAFHPPEAFHRQPGAMKKKTRTKLLELQIRVQFRDFGCGDAEKSQGEEKDPHPTLNLHLTSAHDTFLGLSPLELDDQELVVGSELHRLAVVGQGVLQVFDLAAAVEHTLVGVASEAE